jgi:hypothetical protein
MTGLFNVLGNLMVVQRLGVTEVTNFALQRLITIGGVIVISHRESVTVRHTTDQTPLYE